MVVVIVASALATGACSKGASKAGPSATAPGAPAQTTTTDPYAVPPVIDAAYVNRVLEALDAAVGDVVRLIIRTHDVSPEVFDRLGAVYLRREDVNLFLSSIQRSMREGFTGFRADPGNKRSTVAELLSASTSCIYVRVARDYSQVANHPDPGPSMEWVGLQPRDSSRSPYNYNPTPWMIALEGVTSNLTQPPSPCAGS
jgi:hypothetical protein